MNLSTVSICITLTAVTNLTAKNWVVSTQGDDSNLGTTEQPFATLAKAATVIQPGDTCLIRGGRYHAATTLDQLQGTQQAPITIKAWPGEIVIFDGTQPLNVKWGMWKDGIYRAKVNHPVKQLFQNGKHLMHARWPNADVYDESTFDFHGTWRHIATNSTFGTTIDSTPARSERKGIPWFPNSRIDQNTQTLAETCKDFTGAVAVMNIGSWLTWAQTIKSHKAGSNTFTYDLNFIKSGHSMNRSAQHFPGKPEFWKTKIQRAKEGYYYIEGSLACLDAPGEWYYDPTDQFLYVYPKEGKVKLMSRHIDCSLEVVKSSHIHIKDIQFFATLARFLDSSHIKLDSCQFLFSSTTAFGLGVLTRPETVNFNYSSRYRKQHQSSPTKNKILNCSFKYTNSPGIGLRGKNDLIENCLFYAIDWTCLGDGGEGSLNLRDATELTFRRNTFDLGGNSEGVRVGNRSLIEYNLVSRTSMLQHDGSAINVGVASIDGTILRRNWIHDTAKAGLRFDSSNVGSPNVKYGENGAMIENVCWNTLQLKIKGENHRIIGNTVFGSPRADISVLDNLLMGGLNKKTITSNNLATTISGSFNKSDTPLPGTHHHNWTGDIHTQLRSPVHLDFRPREGSEICGAGQKDSKSCDIGAYQADTKDYWIPGHLSAAASMPVPQNTSTAVPQDCDLMWRPALNAKEYTIHWGTSKDSFTHSASTTRCYFKPPSAQSGTTYFWKVDTLTKDNKLINGLIWEYQIK